MIKKEYYFTQHEPKRAALFRASISHPRYHRLRKHLLAALLTARRIYNTREPAGEESPTGSPCQRTLPPSGRVTTLVPFPFFFRRAFIVVKVKIKHKDNCVIEKLDTKTRKAAASSDKISDFRVINIKRITNMRTLKIMRNRRIRDSAEGKGIKLAIFKTNLS